MNEPSHSMGAEKKKKKKKKNTVKTKQVVNIGEHL
jgi:hypothetical protein